MLLEKIRINNYFFRSLAISSALLATSIPFSSAAVATSKTISIKNHHLNYNLHNAVATASGVTPATLNLVKQYEGFRSYAYIDTSGHPVIGYGQSRIRGRKVRMGQWISRAEADAELARELHHIQRLVRSKIKVQLNPNQLGALTSLVYNAGVRVLHNSTLARKLNSGNYAGAADEFLRWNKAHHKGRLVPLAGLTRRRQAERRLFLTPHR